MNIMMIGGTNFIGPAVADSLEAQGHTLTLFHRAPANSGRAEIQGDCNDVSDLKRAINLCAPDMIIHMVAMFESHVKALEKALSGQKMRVLIVSSADVYKGFEVFNKLSSAPVGPVPFTEESSLREIRFPYRGKPDIKNGHDYEKILVEEAALSSDVLAPVIVRLGMVYGKSDPNRRFKEIIHQINRGEQIIEVHPKVAALQLCKCYVENVAHGIALAAQKGVTGEVYNLAGAAVLTELEWNQTIAKLMDWGGEFVLTPEADATGLVNAANLDQHLTLDSTKIRRELGFNEIIPLEVGLLKTIQWELHPDGI